MFQRITDRATPLLAFLRPLYEDAFPLRERRTWDALLLLLNEPSMHLSAVHFDRQFIGFVIYWPIGKWLYLEHLAIKPALRRQGYGRTVIEYLKGSKDVTLVLETELPHDEGSVRRMEFYKKLGFKEADFKYYQPPYRKGENPFEMKLLIDGQLTKDEFNDVVKSIKHQVYEKFY